MVLNGEVLSNSYTSNRYIKRLRELQEKGRFKEGIGMTFACQGIEFSDGRCEVWTRPEGKGVCMCVYSVCMSVRLSSGENLDQFC